MSSRILPSFGGAPGGRELAAYADFAAAANELAALTPNQTKLPPLRVAVLRNFTVEPLMPVLAGEIALAGFHPQFYVGDFDAVQADVLNPKSALYDFKPDFVVLAQWLETLSPALTTRFLSTPPAQIDEAVDGVRRHVREIVGALNANVRAPILLNNFPLPAEPTLGILDSQSADHQTSTILKLNAHVLADAKEMAGVSIVDFMRLFALHGSANCVDERYWQIARAPLAQKALLPVGAEYGKFVRALRGKTKKCLVVDCDNTLWGGIVGEDGLAGIQLGPTYPGSCFVALQHEILNLHHRGVILAICSKNNEADVLEVLRDHPDTVLKEEHFAVRQINWDDKVTNLRRIAAELNIGADSLVLLDDSAFEVDFVRQEMPEVAVIALPPKAYASYRSLLTSPGWFDSLSFTAEDRRKNAMYGENRERKALESASSSLEDYLAKLEIEVEIAVPSEIDVPRVAQLTQKTNQFNLTTRRYTESDVRAFIASDRADVFALKVRDRISDSGLVGVAILTYADRTATVDSFLLSCRVIGRGVEDALLSFVVRHALDTVGCDRVSGTYVPTAKNAMVADFYARHGFAALDAADGAATWERRAGGGPAEGPAWIALRKGPLTHASR
jgi:FkbH-like protein